MTATPPSSASPIPTSHTVPCPTQAPSSTCPSFPVEVGVTLRTQITCHMAQLDPWRRHSWEPGAVVQGSPQNEHRSLSLEGLDQEDVERLLEGLFTVQRGQDPRRAAIAGCSKELGSLLSLNEKDKPSNTQYFSLLVEQSSQLQGCSASAPALCVLRTEPQRPRSTPRPRSHCEETLCYSQAGGSVLSLEEQRDYVDEWEEKTGSPLGRTLSFFRKMAGTHKNKEKERMKEREKEAREREARYSNGHLFTSLTVSGMTLCSSCNKSITAKEALSCPTCNVTIHNRCRDTLPNCAKMKQRLQKLALVRNSSALQNVTLRTKTPTLRERPISAIYSSDILRQSLLGSRRMRSGLSLSKSVSTNNITGNLNDDSPLGLRRILSQSTDSLNFRNRTMSIESLNDEGEVYFPSMLEELELEGRDFEADSWSTAVDTSYLQTRRKDVIKRQDVIYELIQTELHHVRTLRIMDGVFRRGMLEELLLEPGMVNTVFPCLDRLLGLHCRFLHQLQARRSDSLEPGSTNNFTIQQLGDVLLEQFSGQCAEEMRKAYAEFCSRHPKAVKLYKDLLARDKRFQSFIRRVSRGPLLRRHGILECILLVTQRITKYPVLIQRILDNTKGNEEESSSLSQAVVLIRDLLSSVDQQVLELERTHRLQEVRSRLDPRTEAVVRGGGVFRGAELARRMLIHDGPLLLKTGSRLKDVQVLLMTDILVFIQEKDQKFIFPCLDKPSVLCLKNLIVRDIASQERGMFLISDSTPPDMYELHASSKDDRNTWMRIIRQTTSSCPSRENFPLIETEDKAMLRRIRADIQQKDREVLELLQEKVTLFSDLAAVTGGQSITLPSNSRNLFRADTPQAPRGERLLTEAIAEAERLSELLMGSITDDVFLPCNSNGLQKHMGELVINGQELPINRAQNTAACKDNNGNQLENRTLKEEVFQRLVNLTVQLHALQGAVIKQDSILEQWCREGGVFLASLTATAPFPSTPAGLLGLLSRDEDMGAAKQTAVGDLALLQRQNSLLQEELLRLRASEEKLKARSQQMKPIKAGTAVLKDSQQAVYPRNGSNGDPSLVMPLVSLEFVDQSNDTQKVIDMEANSEDEEGVRISSRSESPRDLQDIPEEGECGSDARESEVMSGPLCC